MGVLLKPAQVCLDGIPSFYFVNCATQLGVNIKVAEGTLNPIIQVKMLKSRCQGKYF